ncbi:UDP glycosyltransferase 8 [Phlyctochytrium bullatum]|nr:UDP glycosyltransferase 8 [Phlyctochytrium bullatum]
MNADPDTLQMNERTSMTTSPKTIAIVVLPARGHFSAPFALAQELSLRGHRPVFVLPENCRSWFWKQRYEPGEPGYVNAHFTHHFAELESIHYQTGKLDQTPEGLGNLLKLIGDLIIGSFSPTLSALKDEIKPDLILYDGLTLHGRIACKIMDAPCVAIWPTLLSVSAETIWLPYPSSTFPVGTFGFELTDTLISRTTNFLLNFLGAWVILPLADLALQKRIRSSGLNLPESVIQYAKLQYPLDDLTISWTSLSFEYPRLIPPNLRLVGTMLPKIPEPIDPQLESFVLNTNASTLLVSFGTTTLLRPAQFRTLLDGIQRFASRTPDVQVLWSLSKFQSLELANATHADGTPLDPFASLASNDLRSHVTLRRPAHTIRFHRWLPQQSLLALPQTKVFISHCGANGVHEALYAATPTLGVPMLADHGDTCQRLARTGAGLQHRLTGADDTDAAEIAAKLERLWTDENVLVNAKFQSAAFKDLGGTERAADLVEWRARWADTLNGSRVAAEKFDQSLSIQENLMLPAWKTMYLDVWGLLIGLVLLGIMAAVLGARAARWAYRKAFEGKTVSRKKVD